MQFLARTTRAVVTLVGFVWACMGLVMLTLMLQNLAPRDAVGVTLAVALVAVGAAVVVLAQIRPRPVRAGRAQRESYYHSNAQPHVTHGLRHGYIQPMQGMNASHLIAQERQRRNHR